MPAHCTASGKALLAQLSPSELRRLYPKDQLEHMTARSLSTLSQLEAELDTVRGRGYATNFGKSESEVAAVAVPIPPGRGDRLASISISGPVTRLEQSQTYRPYRDYQARTKREIPLVVLERRGTR